MSQIAIRPLERKPNAPPNLAPRKGALLLTGGGLLIAVMLLTILEGAGRKWLFPQYPLLRYAAYFSKDIVFIFAAYLGLRRCQRFDLSWIVLCGMLILLPSAVSTMANSNLVGAGLSLRAYLVIPICAFLAAPLVRSFQDVERCAMVVAISAVLVASLGAYQYRLPRTHVLNRYDTGEHEGHINVAGGHVRAAGTFSYIGGMAIMAGFSAWAGMLLVLPVLGRRNWVRGLGAAAVVAGLACAAVSMSRGGLVFWFVTVAGSLMLYLRTSQLLVYGLAISALVVALFVANPADDIDRLGRRDSLASGLAYRIERADSFAERARYVLDNLRLGVTNHPFGEGLGTGQPGGSHASVGVRKGGWYESEWGRIAFEVGPAGLLGAVLVRLGAGVICWRALRQTTNVHRRLVLATALPFFGIMSLGWMAFNHVGSSAAWAVMALALSAVPPNGHDISGTGVNR